LEIKNSSRLAIVDILRGWALLGVVICNMTVYAYNDKWDLISKDFLSTALEKVEHYLFSAKAWTLLSILFGFGFGILLERKNQETGSANVYFIKRMLILFVFAFVNTAFQWGDILRDYAGLGLLLLLFYPLPAKKLFIISICMFLLLPFFSAFIASIDITATDPRIAVLTPLKHTQSIFKIVKYNFLMSYYEEVIGAFYLYTVHYTMFLCMLLGLAAQKTHFFDHLETHRKNLQKIAIVTLVFVLAYNIYFIIIGKNILHFFDYFRPRFWAIIATMLFTTACICLLYLNGKCKELFFYFSLMGKMTLTHYITQNIIAFFLFQGIGLIKLDSLPYYFYFFYAIGIYILQVFFSKWWLSRYQYGPVEWLWRSLSTTRSKSLH
jgi:uncharacterized protein